MIKEAPLLLPNNRITFNGLQLSLFIQTVAGGGSASHEDTGRGTPTTNSLNPPETTVERTLVSLSLSLSLYLLGDDISNKNLPKNKAG